MLLFFYLKQVKMTAGARTLTPNHPLHLFATLNRVLFLCVTLIFYCNIFTRFQQDMFPSSACYLADCKQRWSEVVPMRHGIDKLIDIVNFADCVRVHCWKSAL